MHSSNLSSINLWFIELLLWKILYVGIFILLKIPIKVTSHNRGINIWHVDEDGMDVWCDMISFPIYDYGPLIGSSCDIIYPKVYVRKRIFMDAICEVHYPQQTTHLSQKSIWPPNPACGMNNRNLFNVKGFVEGENNYY